MPDNTIKVQVFQQIASKIEQRIAAGDFPPGSALPSRNDLVNEFNSARATIDRAIAFLVKKGKLVSRHGSGTYVAAPKARKYSIAQIGGGYPAELPIEFDLTILPESEILPRSNQSRLLEFDGVIFVRPEAELIPVIKAVAPAIKTVAVNRVIPGVACVSTDFTEAYRQITQERIAQHPQSRLFFLRNHSGSLALQYRLDGFLEACRNASGEYEVIQLPKRFKDGVELLHKTLPHRDAVIVADALGDTGVFMRWCADCGIVPGKSRQIWYSDFDNDYPENVWGVSVSSFLQDLDELHREATILLLHMLETNSSPIQQLVKPRKKNGTT